MTVRSLASRPAAFALALLTVAACNAVFGIESTELEPPEPPASDSDGDGISNPDDNCVLVANPDQADGDGDVLGDVCDPCADGDTQLGVDGDGDGIDDGCDSCLSGTNHDEDGDGLGDACDVCPSVGGGAQADDDRDGIGDACDSSATTMQRRVFFDGFGPPHSAWNTGFKPWAGTADGFAPTTPMIGSSSFLEGPWNPGAVVSGPDVRVIASVIVPQPELVAYEQRIGISMRTLNSGMPTASCTLRVEGESWTVTGDSSMPTIPPGPTRIELAFTPSGSTGYVRASCTIAGITVVPQVVYDETIALTPSLVANVAAEFEWIDVIE